MNETLPSKNKFYSSLSSKGISDKDYQHALRVCNKFEMKTIKDYHDLHLICDILVLADVFEKLGNNPANICWSSRRLEDVFNTSSA